MHQSINSTKSQYKKNVRLLYAMYSRKKIKSITAHHMCNIKSKYVDANKN